MGPYGPAPRPPGAAPSVDNNNNKCEQLRKRVTELEEMRDASTSLMQVVGDLSKDILLNSREMESLKLH